MPFNRRQFLRTATASTLAGAGLYGMPGALTAHAADTSGYKALVCVFLFGGLDTHDLLLPYDQASYDSFSSVRQTLINAQGAARAREMLLPLTLDNQSAFGSRAFALPPEMPQLHTLFDQGQAALVANVGPLIEPVTAQGVIDRVARVPPRLFSHNDQQATWQASAPEGAQQGWGGLFADAALAAGANPGSEVFTTLSTSGVGPFLTGDRAAPYQISLSGTTGIEALNRFGGQSASGELANFLDAARDRFRAEGFAGSNILAQDIAAKFRDGIDANTAFDNARNSSTPLATTFPQTGLGAQLRTVAETISFRSALFASRQIFFVGIGGFDTHSSQAADLPGLLSEIDGALAAFHQAVSDLGLSQSVTTFTASDFGRTLSVNGDGTDHGWGSHHIVMGGAVRGRNIFGSVPATELGNDRDVGSGRLAPTLSVEQLAEPLGKWWGLSDNELSASLPNLGNFDPASLQLFS